MTRDFRFDHLKFLLIYLVVVGHFLILGNEGLSRWLFRAIYIIHMPVFIFITGYFSRNQKTYSKKLINRVISFVFLYIIFILLQEIVSVFFDYGRFNPEFIKQKGASWYLLVSAIYCLMTPILLKINNYYLMILSITSIVISVLFGNYLEDYSLNKATAFFPMYVIGLKLNVNYFMKFVRHKIILGFVLFVSFFMIIYSMNQGFITPSNIYYKFNYKFLEHSFLFALTIRLFFYILSIGVLLFCFSIVSDKPLITSVIGSHTLSIYIFHVLFRDIFEHVLGYTMTDTVTKLIFILCLSLFIVYIFSRKPFIYIEKIMKIKWIR